MPMLVDPKPRRLRELVPWHEFVWESSQFDASQLREIADELCSRHAAKTGSRARRELTAADQAGELQRELIRVALELGDFAAFVADPTKNTAFLILPSTWAFAEGVELDVYETIDDGIFALEASAFTPGSLEGELANKPLFVETTTMRNFLGRRPPMPRDNQGETSATIWVRRCHWWAGGGRADTQCQARLEAAHQWLRFFLM